MIKQIDFPPTLKTVNLILDKCKNTSEIKDFNNYLKIQLQGILPLNTRLDISHESSHSNFALQATDLFCWGIYRKVTLGDYEWYNLFKEKIRFETIYLNDLCKQKKTVPLTPIIQKLVPNQMEGST